MDFSPFKPVPSKDQQTTNENNSEQCRSTDKPNNNRNTDNIQNFQVPVESTDFFVRAESYLSGINRCRGTFMLNFKNMDIPIKSQIRLEPKYWTHFNKFPNMKNLFNHTDGYTVFDIIHYFFKIYNIGTFFDGIKDKNDGLSCRGIKIF